MNTHLTPRYGQCPKGLKVNSYDAGSLNIDKSCAVSSHLVIISLTYLHRSSNPVADPTEQLWHSSGLVSLPGIMAKSLGHWFPRFLIPNLQSFIAGPVAYKALPRPQFSSLQKAIFPFYFSLQSALPVILALTYPGNNSVLASSASSLQGCLDKSNRYNVLLPILVMTAMNLTNLLVLGPATTRIMKERKHQGRVTNIVVYLRGL